LFSVRHRHTQIVGGYYCKLLTRGFGNFVFLDNGLVRFSYNSFFSACIFSWNSVFPSQQINRNSVLIYFFSEANGAWILEILISEDTIAGTDGVMGDSAFLQNCLPMPTEFHPTSQSQVT